MIQVCRQIQYHSCVVYIAIGSRRYFAEAKQHLADFNAYCKKEGLNFYYLGDYLNYEFKYFGTKGHLNKKGAELATQKFISEYTLKQSAK